MPKVFLSHSHSESELASTIRSALKSLSIDVFDPRSDPVSGGNWRTTVKSGIEAADAIVLVLGSPETARSSWIFYETGAAEGLGKPVIVLAAHDFPSSELPAELEGYVIVDLDPENQKSAARAVLDSLRATA